MKKLATKLYKYMPVFIQNSMISVYGYLLRNQRYGKVYQRAYQHYLSKDYSNAKGEISEQNKLLIDFVNFAKAHSKFYAGKYDGIDLSAFSGVSDLAMLPTVSKEDLRQNIEDVYTIRKKDGITSFTGGTTGKALEVVFTHDDFQQRMAYLDVFKAKVGIDPFGEKKATFSGREFIEDKDVTSKVFWRDNRAYKQRLYSTFHIKDEYLSYYVKDLNSYQPTVLNGFVSAIYELAKFIESNKLELSFRLKGVFTTSETLLPHHRLKIQTVFGCHVYNQYASAEGAPFITECSKQNLHYNLDTGVIEVDEKTNAILVTSFTSHGTPLIRYAIGDTVRFKEGACTCGSAHPLVEEIGGRAVDFLETADGRKVSLSHLADVIKGMPSCVKNVQFCQANDNAVTVKMVVDTALYEDSHDQMVMDSMLTRFGKETQIVLERVDHIERESSGKFALIKKLKKTNLKSN